MKLKLFPIVSLILALHSSNSAHAMHLFSPDPNPIWAATAPMGALPVEPLPQSGQLSWQLTAQQLSCIPAAANLAYIIYKQFSPEKDPIAKQSFNGGVAAVLTVGATLALVEQATKKLLNTDYFIATNMGSAIKIGLSIIAGITAIGFIPGFKNLYHEMTGYKWKNLAELTKGATAGCMLVLPFCSDFQ